MEKSSKRGKIPQQDWPSIISRYESGETLASIARTYDCSPPAISYIVSRTRARTAAAESAGASPPVLPLTEPQLVKATGSTTPTHDMPDHDSAHSTVTADKTRQNVSTETQQSAIEVITSAGTKQSPDAERLTQKELFSPQMSSLKSNERPATVETDNHPPGDARQPRDMHSTIEVGASRPPNSQGPSPQNGDGRRTLHLSLQGNGPASSPVVHPSSQNGNSGSAYDGRPVSRQQGGSAGFAPQTQPRQPSVPGPSFGPPPGPVGPELGSAGMLDQTKKARESGAFIDRALRERIDEVIAAFLAAFDAALDHDTTESRTELREATDRLLRAGARTRIELERLEARFPLHPRDAPARPSSAFRPR
jgi:hypothetical protein